MRIVRVLLVLLAVSLLVGDGHRPEPEWEPIPGLGAAIRFWGSRTGDIRQDLSVPADVRMSAAYLRTQARAHKLGLEFEAPRLRQTRPELALLLGPGIEFFIAVHYVGPRIILVNSWWTDKMSDAELEMALAHELIHAVDDQNERRGSPFLNIFSSADDEEAIAHTLASMMFAPGEYSAFLKKFVERDER